MKTKKLELDVDFIGEQVELTTEDEKAFSDFFRQHKLASKKSLGKSKVPNKKQLNSLDS